MSWPLYLEPTNERRTVHRIRLLAADAISRSIPSHGTIFTLEGVATRLVRFGLPVALGRYTGPWPRRPRAEQNVLIPFIDRRTRETVMRRQGSASDESVTLDLGLAARDVYAARAPSGYVDRHFDALEPFEHQPVQYVRDGAPSVVIHATRPVPLCDSAAPEMGFFLFDERLRLLRRSVDSVSASASYRYRFKLDVSPASYVYSLELLDTPCRQASRARFVLVVRPAPEGFGLSDVVLADRLLLEGPLRVSGAPAVVARGGLAARAGEPVPLYWEVYGVVADTTDADRLAVQFEVVDVRQRRVPVRRLAEVARAAQRAHPALDLRYRVVAPPGAEPLGIPLTVTLPLEAEGLHIVRVMVRDRRSGRVARAERAVYVTPVTSPR